MDLHLDHVAILCEDLDSSVEFYKKTFGGVPTDIRKGAAGYRFCFVKIDGRIAVQLMESPGKEPGVHHYGFVTNDIEQAARDLAASGATVVRENRDAAGKLTTIFLKEPNGLEIEVRIPR
jgi:predicted enzyme related to lactoylglutathione lyase